METENASPLEKEMESMTYDMEVDKHPDFKQALFIAEAIVSSAIQKRYDETMKLLEKFDTLTEEVHGSQLADKFSRQLYEIVIKNENVPRMRGFLGTARSNIGKEGKINQHYIDELKYYENASKNIILGALQPAYVPPSDTHYQKTMESLDNVLQTSEAGDVNGALQMLERLKIPEAHFSQEVMERAKEIYRSVCKEQNIIMTTFISEDPSVIRNTNEYFKNMTEQYLGTSVSVKEMQPILEEGSRISQKLREDIAKEKEGLDSLVAESETEMKAESDLAVKELRYCGEVAKKHYATLRNIVESDKSVTASDREKNKDLFAPNIERYLSIVEIEIRNTLGDVYLHQGRLTQRHPERRDAFKLGWIDVKGSEVVLTKKGYDIAKGYFDIRGQKPVKKP